MLHNGLMVNNLLVLTAINNTMGVLIYVLHAIGRSVLSVDRAAQSMDPLIVQNMLHAGDRLNFVGVMDSHFSDFTMKYFFTDLEAYSYTNFFKQGPIYMILEFNNYEII